MGSGLIREMSILMWFSVNVCKYLIKSNGEKMRV